MSAQQEGQPPQQRKISITVFTIAVIVALVVPSSIIYYGQYTPEVGKANQLTAQLVHTQGVLNQTQLELAQAQANITSLKGTISVLNGNISNLDAQVKSLQSQNSQLQSSLSTAQGQVASLQDELSSLRAPNVIGQGWYQYLCLFGFCVVNFYGAWANTGQNPSYGNVEIQFTAYSEAGDQGQMLCQTTYNLGQIAGQSMILLSPYGQSASCSYAGSAGPGSTTWQIIMG